MIAEGQLNADAESFIRFVHNSAFFSWDEKLVNENFECMMTTMESVRKAKTYASRHLDEVNWTDVSSVTGPTGLTFVDLFSGAGGISKGLELGGGEGICGLDWFKEAVDTYRANFHHPCVFGDISQDETKEEFCGIVESRLAGRELDVVAGGFPCQGFSMAGARVVTDPRNSLYLEMLDVVDRLQPRVVVCENVVGLRSMLKGKVEDRIIKDFAAIGYEMNVTVLRAADYGVPQKRDRVIFIGNRCGLRNLHPEPIMSPAEYMSVEDAVSDLMELPENKEWNHQFTKHRSDMVKRMGRLPQGESLYEGYTDSWRRGYWDQPSCTIKENHGGVNIHPVLPRVFTPRELARLQSFPDDFVFEGGKNKQLIQLGNAVPPLLARAIGYAVSEMLRQGNE